MELIASIASDRNGPVADLASAEQIALSLHSLMSHLTRSDPRLLSSPMVAAIDALFDELETPGDFDRARFVDLLEKLGMEVP